MIRALQFYWGEFVSFLAWQAHAEQYRYYQDQYKPMSIPPFSPMSNLLRLAAELGLKTELAAAILPVVIENLQLLDRKQQDYGPANLIKFGAFGVVVRANDKMERIINLMKQRHEQGALDVKNEAVQDSMLDLANYALIAYVLETGKWGAPPAKIDVSTHETKAYLE